MERYDHCGAAHRVTAGRADGVALARRGPGQWTHCGPALGVTRRHRDTQERTDSRGSAQQASDGVTAEPVSARSAGVLRTRCVDADEGCDQMALVASLSQGRTPSYRMACGTPHVREPPGDAWCADTNCPGAAGSQLDRNDDALRAPQPRRPA